MGDVKTELVGLMNAARDSESVKHRPESHWDVIYPAIKKAASNGDAIKIFHLADDFQIAELNNAEQEAWKKFFYEKNLTVMITNSTLGLGWAQS